jgi:hypothetical protein
VVTGRPDILINLLNAQQLPVSPGLNNLALQKRTTHNSIKVDANLIQVPDGKLGCSTERLASRSNHFSAIAARWE